MFGLAALLDWLARGSVSSLLAQQPQLVKQRVPSHNYQTVNLCLPHRHGVRQQGGNRVKIQTCKPKIQMPYIAYSTDADVRLVNHSQAPIWSHTQYTRSTHAPISHLVL
ncbi:uncharacterized protein MEPE_05190 [Melanopsichium pennsylvanicum]|uniref:Secreted protein n=1 Tax=Melanopsichium pennsylvanicum TaxID=63383 RepID=A0AAJ4XRA4_9BASI|nr:uncharacterized protein MEPE_05190 [Melanopsichium pennsylvanicum]